MKSCVYCKMCHSWLQTVSVRFRLTEFMFILLLQKGCWSWIIIIIHCTHNCTTKIWIWSNCIFWPWRGITLSTWTFWLITTPLVLWWWWMVFISKLKLNSGLHHGPASFPASSMQTRQGWALHNFHIGNNYQFPVFLSP